MATTRSHRPPATPITRNHRPVPALTIASTGERHRTTRGQPVCSRGDVLMTAADLAEIETLRAENTRLRAAARLPEYPGGVFHFRGKSTWKREAYNMGNECPCTPYVDILTAGRWRALGCSIKAGESAMHRAGRLGNTPLFCRCQVEDHMAPAQPWTPGEEIPF
mgnify:CR=1 FL=1